MFHPRHRCAAMRERLSGGHSAAPILVYVGRLGAGAVLQNYRLGGSHDPCVRAGRGWLHFVAVRALAVPSAEAIDSLKSTSLAHTLFQLTAHYRSVQRGLYTLLIVPSPRS